MDFVVTATFFVLFAFGVLIWSRTKSGKKYLSES
jgi:hypothetical protein